METVVNPSQNRVERLKTKKQRHTEEQKKRTLEPPHGNDFKEQETETESTKLSQDVQHKKECGS